MSTKNFELPSDIWENLKRTYPNLGKNRDVGMIAVEIVRQYFLSIDPAANFQSGTKGADLIVTHNNITEQFEIKGTTDIGIAWTKLKVSSQNCHDALVNGMTLIRVTGIGDLKVKLHFLQHGKDFTLVREDRWAVRKI